MCSLPKEEFLARAPAFMGDILWAHLEILQKDVDRGANIENVPSNYSESFAIPSDAFQRTYAQLDVVQSTTSSSLEANNRPHYTQRPSNCYTTTGDYSNNGSTVDSSSEFSYQMEMKYSPNQQVQINNGRVPAYPPPSHLYGSADQFENMWSYQSVPQPQPDQWHQPPHDYNPAVTPPAPPSSTNQTQMHHHPAFLQVRHHNFFFLEAKYLLSLLFPERA